MMRLDPLAIVLACCLLLGATGGAHAWHSEELEIFDLVEEVNRNFYEFMGINQTATGPEVKRAFRTLSIVLHPDKNAAEDANIQFRNLAVERTFESYMIMNISKGIPQTSV